MMKLEVQNTKLKRMPKHQIPIGVRAKTSAGEEAYFEQNDPDPDPTAIELRSADFSPPRSGPAKTAGSGLKSALLSCRDSLNSITLNRYSHPNVLSVVGTSAAMSAPRAARNSLECQ